MTEETEADVIMWAAAVHAEADKARYAAVKKKLQISTFNGLRDVQLARAWRDLGFPPKRFMREALQRLHEPLERQEGGDAA